MTDKTNHKIIEGREVRQALEETSRAAFHNFEESLNNGEAGKTVTLFGFIKNVDAPLAGLISGFYNEGARRIGKMLAPKSYEISQHVLGKYMQGATLNRASTVVAVGANMALSGAGYFTPLVTSFRNHRTTYKETARNLAPVLDDICGNHSVAALMSVRDNEMIVAHRKRLALKMGVENTNNIINMVINAGPAIFETEGLKHMWVGPQHVQTTPAQPSKANELIEWIMGSFAVGRGSIASYIITHNERKLGRHGNAPTALEMVQELERQVSSDPHARGYQMPGQHHGHDYPLAEYIKQIMIQHQVDMADISDKHTEIRDALKDDLYNVSKRLAQAISNGDIGTLSLVRMIGEGRIIKKQGRAIAPIEDVDELIRQASGKQSSYVHVDPAEYYKDASFNREQLKAALKGLEGDEKRIFASMFPDSILEEAGMSTKDIKAMRDSTAKEYDKLIAEAIVGLNSKTDDELKTMNLAQNEIKHLRDAADSISAGGIEAVKEMKIAVAGDRGVEHLLANAVVHDVKNLGLVVEKGRSALKEIDPKDKELSSKDLEDANEMSQAAIARAQRTAREGKMPELGEHTGRLGRSAEMHDSAELGL